MPVGLKGYTGKFQKKKATKDYLEREQTYTLYRAETLDRDKTKLLASFTPDMINSNLF